MSSEDNLLGTDPAIGQNQSVAPGSSQQVGGQYNTVPPTLSNGQLGALQLTSSGALIVSTGGGGTQVTSDLADGSITGGAVGTKAILIGAQYNTSLPTLTNAQMAALQADIHGCLILGASANVIGAVTQSGSWTVGVSGSVAVTGTFWQATQPVSAASLPLPTGAATSANQATEISSLSTIATNSGVNQANVNGSLSVISNLTTAVQTFTAPSKAVGFLLEADDGNVANVYWGIGSTNPTASSGMKLQPGRDSGYIPCGASVNVIASTGSSQVVSIQWVMQS